MFGAKFGITYFKKARLATVTYARPRFQAAVSVAHVKQLK